MRKKPCESCFWFEQCASGKRCSFYTPVDDEAEDEYIEEQNQKNYRLFIDEWRSYVTGFYD